MAEGLQKVTVAAKDKSGLEKGLEKAKEVVEGMPEMEDEEEEDKEEGGPLSPEEEEMLKKLLARKS
jgi:hypothetical protein